MNPDLDRLLSRAVPEPNSGCWLWIGGACSNGYGNFKLGGQTLGAHQASWDLHGRGPRKGLFVCHRCDTPLCVNPDHLFLGTHQSNMDDMARKGRSSRSGMGGARPGTRRGAKNTNARLTEDDVISIRRAAESGEIRRETARRFGVSKPTITGIVRRYLWPHVE